MSSKAPPVPHENQSPKGTGDDKRAPVNPAHGQGRGPDPDTTKQGQQGNTRVNTTHQGYQQDR